MKRILLLSALLLGLLAACVPAGEGEAIEVQQLSEPVSFYPQEAGATWQFLPTGAGIDEPKIVQKVEGPTVVGGELWIVTHLQGFGLDNSWYRQYQPDGVFLLQENRPGQQVSYNPPVQEYPASDTLNVGSTWGGDTVASVFYPEAKPENQRLSYPVEYRYTVVDRRQVDVPAGTFEVYVIDFEARFLDKDRNVIQTQKLTTWFTPYVGEVKTENDFYLVATNTTGQPKR